MQRIVTALSPHCHRIAPHCTALHRMLRALHADSLLVASAINTVGYVRCKRDAAKKLTNLGGAVLSRGLQVGEWIKSGLRLMEWSERKSEAQCQDRDGAICGRFEQYPRIPLAGMVKRTRQQRWNCPHLTWRDKASFARPPRGHVTPRHAIGPSVTAE